MRLLIVGTAALSLALSACASVPEASLWQGYADHPQGYLGADSRFEALAFLPPPPHINPSTSSALYPAPPPAGAKPQPSLPTASDRNPTAESTSNRISVLS